ncbi:DUF2848 domain-containing protein [Granulosicoccus sp.]|jgi:hypothetical protein|nr:DUF2848 domain-containing protein [Granulosicoccus sp.]MDB4222127.1 DUF2848 domain-containing protein [Granulosicoccus sp.]
MIFVNGEEHLDCTIDQLIVAGWTGRNSDAVNHHIEELAQLGISPPSTVPLYYRVSDSLLTQSPHIQVLGSGSSGEVEPLILRQQDNWYLGLASDHTDRELEAHSVAASKQACVKPVASQVWELDSVINHLDDIQLRCSIKENDEIVLYQSGFLAALLPLQTLINDVNIGENAAMLCGTLAAIDSVRPATEYYMELIDPILNRRISLNYTVSVLPIIN